MFVDVSYASHNYQSTQSNRSFAQSNVRPIPLIYSSNNNSNPTAQHPRSQRHNADICPYGSRPSIRTPGECDPFGIDIAPLNIFENQVIPVGVHNLSKSFRPNMATIHV